MSSHDPPMIIPAIIFVVILLLISASYLVGYTMAENNLPINKGWSLNHTTSNSRCTYFDAGYYWKIPSHPDVMYPDDLYVTDINLPSNINKENNCPEISMKVRP